MKTISLHISGMACGGCANTVTQALQGLDGVISAEVSYVESRAEVAYDEAKVQPEAMRAAVETAGYQVK